MRETYTPGWKWSHWELKGMLLFKWTTELIYAAYKVCGKAEGRKLVGI